MLTVFLIRHAESEDCTTRLVGRTPGVGLTARGRWQALRLPSRLSRYVSALDAIYVSPLQRAIETAAPLGRVFGIIPQWVGEFTEVDFGIWTGVPFTLLDRDESWRRYNGQRAAAVIPGGESVAALRDRVQKAVQFFVSAHRRGTIAVVTHAEIIRTIVLECSSRSLDEFSTVAIDPASISAIRFFVDGACEVVFVNTCSDQPAAEFQGQDADLPVPSLREHS
jgi:probable phosphoglycerate mutase